MNTLDLSPRTLQTLAHTHGTPLWVMDAPTIRRQVERLRAFDAIRYAQKANPNTHVLRLMRSLGVKVDAVSRGEALRALAAGYCGGAARAPLAEAAAAEIVYTADLLDRESLDFVVQQGLVVNCGSLDMLHQLGARSPGHAVWLRLNPGFGHGHSRKTNTGGEGSKHGIWHTQLAEALAVIRATGLRLLGLHMHIGSGVDYGHLAQVGAAMLAALTVVHAAGMDVHAVSAGGGLSIPYRAGDPAVDTDHYFACWDAPRRAAEALFGHPLHLEIEPGRFLVAEAGCLLTEVRAVKRQGAVDYVLVDAGFNELMRPAMYGAHHGLRLIPADERSAGALQPTVVAGPLCESGDVFTQGEGGELRPQPLPPAVVGDLLVVDHTGAYGSAMSSNYNSRPLAAEVLVDGATARLIRRRQSVEELLALEAV
ncbi:diaminopimelate decarboxylase [Inhella gelatinilytica]|uniref:Diaminopimelate decarboxylase n=1 Tax=Inhella gelatinilytica TaxID=2795030 RepID=A0A931IZ93_9BURK|nr:diaminopimelate decarboxylase [Inhella gelatinilytica]MBH9552713.1 diaminopimelate decarboxylase [Inhella gelatinilytica]